MKVKGIEIPVSQMRNDPSLWMQNCIRINLGLDDKDYQLLTALEENLEGGWCFLSKEDLSKVIRLTRSNVVLHLNGLVKKGIVERNSKVPQVLKLTHVWFAAKEKYKKAK